MFKRPLRGLGGGPIMRNMNDTVEMLALTVNGEAMSVPQGTTLAGLLALMELDRRKVAVERNLEIVPRSLYEATPLAARDAIEIVHFVGGG